MIADDFKTVAHALVHLDNTVPALDALERVREVYTRKHDAIYAALIHLEGGRTQPAVEALRRAMGIEA